MMEIPTAAKAPAKVERKFTILFSIILNPLKLSVGLLWWLLLSVIAPQTRHLFILWIVAPKILSM